MVIDFHTHLFPEKIAAKALHQLAVTSGITPSTDGTAAGLLSSMERCGIDISVVLPVVTTPHQYDSILRFASQINEENAGKKEHRLLSLGGIHPDCEDIPGKIAQLAREGFKGIKLHPHYQGSIRAGAFCTHPRRL